MGLAREALGFAVKRVGKAVIPAAKAGVSAWSEGAPGKDACWRAAEVGCKEFVGPERVKKAGAIARVAVEETKAVACKHIAKQLWLASAVVAYATEGRFPPKPIVYFDAGTLK